MSDWNPIIADFRKRIEALERATPAPDFVKVPSVMIAESAYWHDRIEKLEKRLAQLESAEMSDQLDRELDDAQAFAEEWRDRP